MTTIDTSVGPARAWDFGPAKSEVALVLGHGAGGGIQARDLQGLAAQLPGQGIAVILVEQPWRVAGKRVAPAPSRLDQAWCDVISEWSIQRPGLRLVLGGRSAGARVACRTAPGLGADHRICGVLALAFPLHPPGKPDRSRAEELIAASVPLLVVQGTRDPFGSVAEVREAARGAKRVVVEPIEGADHGFRVPARGPISQEAALERISAHVLQFARTLRA